MCAQLYTDIAQNQRDGLNFPGGGLTTQPGQYNDPVKELGAMSLVTAVYTMTGGELANDVINICRIIMGAIVDPSGNVTGNGIATTATITVGDTDTVGATVSADASRYSGSINVAPNMTAPLAFASGTALVAPAETTDDPVWLTATFATLATPVAGKVLVFRIKISYEI